MSNTMQTTGSLPSHWLPNHVYVCPSRSGAIFLDIRADRYVGIGAGDAAALYGIVRGWPMLRYSVEGDLSALVVNELVTNLVSRGLLVSTEHPGKPVTEISLKPPDEQALASIGQDTRSTRRIVLPDLWRFASACLEASWLLHLHSFEHVVRYVVARKNRALAKGVVFDPEKAAVLTSRFRILRVFVFTAKNHCLFHTICLLGYLARHGLHPTWMIGVESAPFAAHSWVQHERWVLDATPEQICFFTPIFSA
jgi:hypothetical protein